MHSIDVNSCQRKPWFYCQGILVLVFAAYSQFVLAYTMDRNRFAREQVSKLLIGIVEGEKPTEEPADSPASRSPASGLKASHFLLVLFLIVVFITVTKGNQNGTE